MSELGPREAMPELDLAHIIVTTTNVMPKDFDFEILIKYLNDYRASKEKLTSLRDLLNRILE